ncbi:hypothetical protein [Actinoplanes sp. NPDC089786]|uniref:hypothetical protein n=1 Tax=Actinoplanes sp. NPDC089786 TaxID=3155185 RepID=UPI0034197EE5
MSSAAAEIRSAIGNDPQLVEFGNMTATGTLVVYRSGPADAAALTTIKQVAARTGTTVIVAPRKVTRAQIEAATKRIEAGVGAYQSQGIAVSTFGGFAADFDGVQVNIDPGVSKVQDLNAVRSRFEADLGVPVRVSRAAGMNAAGRYDDTSPFNAGGLMVSNTGICSSGFGVTSGASVHRYISARHCTAGPYRTDSGSYSMGDISLTGTGFNGSAVFSAQGSALVFDGTNAPPSVSTRLLTQRDPALSTVGTPVCNQGANSGQRCGTIAQVALNWNDGFGTIRVNFVTSPSDAISGFTSYGIRYA